MAEPLHTDRLIDADTLGILDLMLAASQKLPVGWQDADFAFQHAQALAKFIVAHRDRIDATELGGLLAAGGVLVATWLSQAVQP